MDPNGWTRCEGTWDRLRWARTRWQDAAGAVRATATDAAVSIGMEPGTYRTYERPPGSSKHTPLDHQAAIRFGRKFKVSWTWLLTGEGSPFEHMTEPQERAIRAMAAIPEDQQAALAEMVEAYARRAGAAA